MSEKLKACVRQNECIGCKTCASVCPVNAFYFENSKAFVKNDCIGCCVCASVCPIQCIEIKLTETKK